MRIEKKLWNMKVTIIPTVIGVFGAVIKGIGRLGSWRPNRDHPNKSIIENDSWRLEETCCHSNSSEKPSANAYVKNS